MRPLLALLLAVAVGCASGADNAQRPDPTSAPTQALTNLATPTPTPTAPPSPTATGTAIYETASGLECYTEMTADVEYEPGMVDEHGNTQLHLYGEQIINSLWAISRAEFCDNPSTYIPH